MTQPLWRGLTHQELYDQLHSGPGPYVSESAVNAWNDVEAALRKIDGDLSAAITAAGGWTGAAADAARGGLTPLGKWAVDAAAAAGRAGVSISGHQEQVAIARNAMPEPGPATTPTPPAGRIDNPQYARWVEQQATDADLAQQAFHVMNTYATNTGLIQRWVPTWSAPPTVTVAVHDPSAAGTAGARPAAGAASATPHTSPVPAPTATAGTGGPAPANPGTAGQNGVAPKVSPAPPAPDASPSPGGVAPTAVAAGPQPSPSGGPASGPPPTLPSVPATPSTPDRGGIPAAGPVPAPVIGGGDPGGARPSAPTTWRDLPDLVRTGPPGSAPEAGRQPAVRPGPEPGPGSQPAGSVGSLSGGTPEERGGYLPMGGAPMGGQGQTRRRADFLVDDSGAFDDNRWFTEAVIGGAGPI